MRRLVQEGNEERQSYREAKREKQQMRVTGAFHCVGLEKTLEVGKTE